MWYFIFGRIESIKINFVSFPKVGTTFWFDLPLAANDADELLIESTRARRQLELEQENDLI